MNKEFLLEMADYIETIPQEDFDMGRYRADEDFKSAYCNTVGCALGHCTHLFPEEEIKRWEDGIINFVKTSEYLGLTDPEWKWCFSGDWYYKDNTPKGAAKRIRMLVNGEVTANMLNGWRDWDKPQY